MIKRLDHIAIAVRDLESASRFYTEHLGLHIEKIEEVPSQNVRVAFIPIGDTCIELVEPTSEDSPIMGFLNKRGEGLHHLCVETDHLEAELDKLNAAQVKMIDRSPKPGAHDKKIAFVHPKANSGVLLELSQPPTPAPAMPPKETPLKAGDLDTLRTFFESSYKPISRWKIGLEYELGVVHKEDLSPMGFFGERNVEGLFAKFRERYGDGCAAWEDGFCFGLDIPYGGLSLEPGAQLEFGSNPTASIAEMEGFLERYMSDLSEIGAELDLAFYSAGVDPFHSQSEMPWSHKARYKTMRKYLATRGTLGHRMMQQTTSIQFNIDFGDEADAVLKYQACRALQPLLLFLSSNSQIYEGKALDSPMRGEIWLNTDPDRCGLPPSIEKFDDYTEYALDIPMFFIERDGYVPIANGLTFRQFVEQGFEGYTARFGDWATHLSTLFPEVRFKRNALELRMFDGNPPPLALAFAALTKGIFFQREHLNQVLSRSWEASWEDAARLLEMAKAGLPAQEHHYLAPLAAHIESRTRPGERALEVLRDSNGDLRALLEHLQVTT